MRKLIMFAGLLFVGVLAWRMADTLTTDALGMAIGVLFGTTAGIPTCVLLIKASRRTEPPARPDHRYYGDAQVREPAPKIEVHNHYHNHLHVAPHELGTIKVLPHEKTNNSRR